MNIQMNNTQTKTKTYVLHIDDNEKNIFKNSANKNMIDDTHFNYFKGVDGKQFIKEYSDYLSDFNQNLFRTDELDLYNYIQSYKNKYNKPLISSCGAWGHLLSFINIIEDAILNEYDRIIIYEFDAIFINNYNYHFNKFKSIICDSERPIVYLGASQLNWSDIIIKENMYHANNYTNGTFAIVFDKIVFTEYLHLLKLKIIPSDTCIFFLKKPKYVFYPNLVIADITVSKIRTKQDIKKISKILKWNLKYYNLYI